MKRIVCIITSLVLLSGAAVPAAQAGSAGHHRWEGAALTLGAIGLIGILSSFDSPMVTARVTVPGGHYAAPPRRMPERQRRIWVPGYWEYSQVWVPGHWEMARAPESYDYYGEYRPRHDYGNHRPGRHYRDRPRRGGRYRRF